jgi:hypothetical protein
MANWTTLKAAIAGIIKTNGNQEITGAVLQNTLNSVVNTVGENATFVGIATPATSPGNPDGPVFYLATQPGIYSNFDGFELKNTALALLCNDTEGAWTNYIIVEYSQELGNSDNKTISQKVITSEIYKGVRQKFATVREIPFISLDSPNHELFINDASSTYKGLILKPLRNTKYKCPDWKPYLYGSYIRYYKGDVSPSAKCVYADDTNMYGRDNLITPDVDFDFAVINIAMTNDEYGHRGFYPTSHLCFSSIGSEDVSDNSIPGTKLISGSVSANQLDVGINSLLKKINTNNQWKGKKICIIGTSTAYGSTAEKAYAKIASENLGFEIIPAVVPGQAIHAVKSGDTLIPLTYGSTCLSKAEYVNAKNIGKTKIEISKNPEPIDGKNWVPGSNNYNNYYRTWENIFTEENADTSLWVFATGPNNTNFTADDWNAFDLKNWRYSDGSSFEQHRTSFLGAMLYLMDKMYKLGVNQRMVLVIDSAYNYNGVEHCFNILHNTWNIPVINLWNKMNTSPKSLQAICSDNGTNGHPSTFGQEKMGEIFTNELLLIS